MLPIHEQIIRQIKGAKRLLVTCRAAPHIDSLASCLVVLQLCRKLGVAAEAVVACAAEEVERYAFLPGFVGLRTDGAGLAHLVVRVAGGRQRVRDFRYDLQGDDLHIYLHPARGVLEAAYVTVEQGQPNYDLIIICDTPDLNALGELYRQHADFFYRTAIVNVDHDPGNEHFGQINLVDITAVATTEVLFRLIQSFGDDHVDADIATTILAGMVAKTNSFKAASVTPGSLMVAAELIQHGGRRDEIISHLYHQHDLTTLKLWGRVLARLQHDEERGLVWSAVRRDDFEKSGASERQLPGLIEELIMSSPKAKVVTILYEQPSGGIGGWLKTEPHLNALTLTKPYGGIGSATLAAYTLPAGSLEEAVRTIRSILPVVSASVPA